MDIARVRERIRRYIWAYDARNPHQDRLRLSHYLQILLTVLHDLADGMIGLRAMSLVFTTLLSIVPLLAISLTLLKGFGIHDQLEPTLLELLSPLGEAGHGLTARIVGFVDNVRIGVLGGFGLGLLMFTVLSLIHKVESALNHTWRLNGVGNLKMRVINYLSVLLVVPFVTLAAVILNLSINHAVVLSFVTQWSYADRVIVFGGGAIPYLLILSVFLLIYQIVPNTTVRFRSAFFGALIATLLWKISGLIFGWFIGVSTSYTAIYSGFAIYLMLMMWIYIGWLIVLTGSSFVYYHQYPERLKRPDDDCYTTVHEHG